MSHGNVVVVGTVCEAEEALADATRNWDALIVDLGLPDGCGLTVLARFRERSQSSHALVLTGHCTTEFVNAAYDLDAQFVAKPSDASRIRNFLNSAGLHGPSVKATRPAEANGRVPRAAED
jgi:DNA-binding NarL/FixJ family response regulator